MDLVLYHIAISIRDKDGKLVEHPRGGMFTGFKFWQYYSNYQAMELDFKLIHEEFRMLMPDKQFTITASLSVDNFGTGKTYSKVAAWYGPEDRFVIFS